MLTNVISSRPTGPFCTSSENGHVTAGDGRRSFPGFGLAFPSGPPLLLRRVFGSGTRKNALSAVLSTEGRVVGPCWEESKSKGPKGTGGRAVIRKEASPFYRTSSGVCLCWELEEPEGPAGRGLDLDPPRVMIPGRMPGACVRPGILTPRSHSSAKRYRESPGPYAATSLCVLCPCPCRPPHTHVQQGPFGKWQGLGKTANPV